MLTKSASVGTTVLSFMSQFSATSKDGSKTNQPTPNSSPPPDAATPFPPYNLKSHPTSNPPTTQHQRQQSQSQKTEPFPEPPASFGQRPATPTSPARPPSEYASSPANGTANSSPVNSPRSVTGRQRSSSRPLSMVMPYQPPLMDINEDTIPELQPIFTFLNSHANKLYQEGYFLKLDDQNTRKFYSCLILFLVLFILPLCLQLP